MDMKNIKQNLDFSVIEINILVLVILCYLFRTTIPYLKFPFLILFSGLFLFSIIRYSRKTSPGVQSIYQNILFDNFSGNNLLLNLFCQINCI